jgi:hypothetical protein
MREYGQIQCAFWAHPKISGLHSEAKLLAAYLLTGPHSNGLGCYRCPSGYVRADLNWDIDTVSKAFKDLIDISFCIRCDTTEWILIPDYLEWNKIANPKVAAARVKEARECPKRSSVWAPMVIAMKVHAQKHLPDDFKKLLFEEWAPMVSRIPEKTRENVYARDGSKCTECGTSDDLTIDHIRPLVYGGTHNESNLRVLCRSCNSKWFPNSIETVSKQEPIIPDPIHTLPDPDPEPEHYQEHDKIFMPSKPVDRFDEFWEAFADKRGKEAALKTWNRKKLNLIADDVIAGAIKYSAIRGADRKFWKQAQGWLNDGRWEDDVGANKPASKFDTMDYGEACDL